ncbi:hypothetical protein [Pseudomonas sp. NPDC090592]|uniref:hypothetical protein n=1 Tax=Pseudomonas sp. NPDC090592 TaxID=3364480 RepID=UPI00383A04FD
MTSISGCALTLSNCRTGSAQQLTDIETDFLHSLDRSGQLEQLAVRVLVYNQDRQLAVQRVHLARALDSAQGYGLTAGKVSRTLQPAGGDYPAARKKTVDLDAPENAVFYQAEADFFSNLMSLSDAHRQQFLRSKTGQQTSRKALLLEITRLYLLARANARQNRTAEALVEIYRMKVRLEQRNAQHDERFHKRLAASKALLKDARLRQMDSRSHTDITLHSMSLIGGSSDLAEGAGVERARTASVISPPKWLGNMTSTRLLKRLDLQSIKNQLAVTHPLPDDRRQALPVIHLTDRAGMATRELNALFTEGTGGWPRSAGASILGRPAGDAGEPPTVDGRVSFDIYEKTVKHALADLAQGLDERETLIYRARSQSALNDLAWEQLRPGGFPAEIGAMSTLDDVEKHIQALLTERALEDTLLAIQMNVVSLCRTLWGVDSPALLI